MAKFNVLPNLMLSLLLGGFVTMTCHAFAQQTNNDPGDGRILLHSFATGQQFFIQKDSFQPTGNGKLQYSVTSDGTPDGRRVSNNEIDCRTGQMKSPINSWSDSGNGQASNPTDGSSAITTLTKRTRLYDDMKDACQQAMPDLKMNW